MENFKEEVARQVEPLLSGSVTPGEEIVAGGQTLRRTQTQFTSAIAIQKPRDRNHVITLCEEEATIAGDEFYYSWTVKKRQGGSALVEGLSVNAALAAARNWGNCAIPCQLEETKNEYIFTATFLDMETGFNLQRIYRQSKKKNIGSKMDDERQADIIFQIGQSKALRNVILNALPSWLTSKMIKKAKENVIGKIEKMGVAKAREKTLAFFARYDVTPERIEAKIGCKVKGWDAEILATLQGAMNALLNGQESAESLFPTNGDNDADSDKFRFLSVDMTKIKNTEHLIRWQKKHKEDIDALDPDKKKLLAGNIKLKKKQLAARTKETEPVKPQGKEEIRESKATLGFNDFESAIDDAKTVKSIDNILLDAQVAQADKQIKNEEYARLKTKGDAKKTALKGL
jgi:hypothetical protein